MAWLLLAVMIMLTGIPGAASAEVTHDYNVASIDGRHGISGIAHKLCGDASLWRRIAKDNNLARPYVIHVGDRLKVTCDGGSNVDLPKITPVASATTAPKAVIRRVSYARAATSRGLVLKPVVEAPKSSRKARRARQVAQPNPEKEFILDVIAATFGPDAEMAAAIFTAENNLKRAGTPGYNCYYKRHWWSSENDVVSKACKPKDRHKAWSIDCGVAQINTKKGIRVNGLLTCPRKLLDIEYNIAHAKKMFDERGWQPWVTYKKGLHKPFVGRFRGLQARASKGRGEVLLAANTAASNVRSGVPPRAHVRSITFPPRAIITSVSYSP